jgi:hypothetical protein
VTIAGRTRRSRTMVVAARHPSAAGGAVALARAARRRRFGVEVFASGPAWSGLSARGMAGLCSFATAHTRYPGLAAFTGPERIERELRARPAEVRRQVERMVTWLQRYLAEARPTVVVLTDATEQLGADQLLAVAARRNGIPTLRVRDAWGTGEGIETRAWRDILPDALRREGLATRYLEIDEQGVELSVRRLGIPRARLKALHGLYTLDRLVGRATPARRARVRRVMGVAPGERLVIFFVQPTFRERAEVDALDACIAALGTMSRNGKSVTIATQEHPREADPADGRSGLNWAAARARATYQGRVINLTPLVLGPSADTSFEDTMVAADVFASSYSNASIETTVLGATAAGLPSHQRPIGFHTLCPARVRTTMRATRAGMDIMPFASLNALPHAVTPQAIASTLSRLLFRPESREVYFKNMRRHWSPGDCADRVIDEALQLVNES